MELRDAAIKRTNLMWMDPHDIHIQPDFNPRDFLDPASRELIDTLKASIRLLGVKKPLDIHWDGEKAWLVDGECRLRAAQELVAEGVDLKAIPCIQVEKGLSPADMLMLALLGNGGKPLTPMESGVAYRKLLAFGWDEAGIAAKVNQTVRFVREAIALSQAPEPIRHAVRDKKISAPAALKVVREMPEAKAVEHVEQAVAASGGKTVHRAKTPSITSWERTGRAILRETSSQMKQIHEEKEVFEFVSVSVRLIEDLEALARS